MPEERRSFDRITERVKNFCALVMAITTIVAAVMTTAWALYAVPDIDGRIEGQIRPVKQTIEIELQSIRCAQEYQSAQLRATLTPAEAKKADEIYQQMRRARGMQ